FDWGTGEDSTYINIAGGTSFDLTGDKSLPPLALNGSIGYNDGAAGTESGISDINVSAAMTFDLKKITITPSLNYTITPGDRVNTQNEFWAGLNFGFKL
ncbi:MAG TPA: hypothetical protein PLQ76_05690, partial [bacterium]|nr:hypothetical protein [bacterium]